MMNSKERVMTAVSKTAPDRLPMSCGKIDDLEYWKTSFGVDSEIELRRKWGLDTRKMSYANIFAKEPGLTIWGCEDNYDAGYSTTKFFPLAKAGSVADIEKHKWPTIENVDFNEISKEISMLDKDCARIGTIGFQAIFCTLCDLFGMDTTMINMHIEPKLIEAAIEKIESFVYLVMNKLLDENAEELDFMWYGDDFSTQRGMMISPEMWRMYLKPSYMRIFELIKSYDVGVWFHSCGSFAPVIGWMRQP